MHKDNKRLLFSLSDGWSAIFGKQITVIFPFIQGSIVSGKEMPVICPFKQVERNIGKWSTHYLSIPSSKAHNYPTHEKNRTNCSLRFVRFFNHIINIMSYFYPGKITYSVDTVRRLHTKLSWFGRGSQLWRFREVRRRCCLLGRRLV